MEIEHIDLLTELPKTTKPQAVTRLYPENEEGTKMLDGKETIFEMKIDGEVNPDIAWIIAEDTPVERYDGEGEITEILFKSVKNGTDIEIDEKYIPPVFMPIGVIFMSSEGKISLKVYNPNTDGGMRGFTVKKGETMQIIIPPEAELTFYEYWSPKGFCSPIDGDKLYGETVLKEVEDVEVLNKFSKAREELDVYLKSISK